MHTQPTTASLKPQLKLCFTPALCVLRLRCKNPAQANTRVGGVGGGGSGPSLFPNLQRSKPPSLPRCWVVRTACTTLRDTSPSVLPWVLRVHTYHARGCQVGCDVVLHDVLHVIAVAPRVLEGANRPRGLQQSTEEGVRGVLRVRVG
jgi:hypothetical protein